MCQGSSRASHLQGDCHCPGFRVLWSTAVARWQCRRKASKQWAGLFHYLPSQSLTAGLFLPELLAGGHGSHVGTAEKFHEYSAKATEEGPGEASVPCSPKLCWASHRDVSAPGASRAGPSLRSLVHRPRALALGHLRSTARQNLMKSNGK